MNGNWIVLAMGVTGAFVMVAMVWRRRDHLVDLGTVSHQWMAEHRLGHGHGPQG